ncbi:recombinase family protein [Alicyclobacillus suci]|uniref:recombinase family protein n=1 Tax=Alicyclobacillus suci TaxID=2816080 RepID=UPI001A8C7A03|nr:recombinase family protein [Alicyclobacillus suci]
MATDENGRLEYIEAVSAFKTHMSRRKVLMQAVEDARAGKYDVLIVFKLDRFGRRSAETFDYVMKFMMHIRIWVVEKRKEIKVEGSLDEISLYLELWQAGSRLSVIVMVRKRMQSRFTSPRLR